MSDDEPTITLPVAMLHRWANVLDRYKGPTAPVAGSIVADAIRAAIRTCNVPGCTNLRSHRHEPIRVAGSSRSSRADSGEDVVDRAVEVLCEHLSPSYSLDIVAKLGTAGVLATPAVPASATAESEATESEDDTFVVPDAERGARARAKVYGALTDARVVRTGVFGGWRALDAPEMSAISAIAVDALAPAFAAPPPATTEGADTVPRRG